MPYRSPRRVPASPAAVQRGSRERPTRQGLTEAAVPIIAGLICVAAHFAFARIGYAIADEGYLFLNTLRTLGGLIPVADMESYDPGRYYWSAAWMSLLGSPNLTGLRVSIGLLLGLALGVTTWVQRHALGTRLQILPWVAVILLWLGPRHKGYEVAVSLLAVSVGYLVLVAGPRQAFAAGAFVGLAGIFGRNHGFYTGMQVGILLLVSCRIHCVSIAKILVPFLGGVVTGYAPEWLLLLFKQGFLEKFNNLNEVLLAHGATNLPLPVPWPWQVAWSAPVTFSTILRFSTGLGFMLIPFVILLSGVCLIESVARTPRAWSRPDLLLLSATVAAPFYGHHAFSRADLFHLAQGIHPTLIAASCLIHAHLRRKWQLVRYGLIGWVSIATLGALGIQPAFAWLYPGRSSYVPVEIQGERIEIIQSDAELIARVTRGLRAAGGLEPGTRVLIAPHWPGLYPVLGQECPTYSSYFIFPEILAVQKQMVGEIESNHVTHVLLGDTTIDGRNELRFANTNALLMRHIERNYTRLPDQSPQFSIWVRTARFDDSAVR